MNGQEQPMTEQERQDMRQLIVDLDLFSSTFKELEGQMTSTLGREIVQQFIATSEPVVKQMKAMCLVELGDV